ncbi:MAG: hypothetical protein KA099_10630 [Alphaproteobacteria bacterium]|jgi:hypothetical protein|nr:hypothetical protein [Alphaproteobacteria bacterium]MBP7758513.1 hypothetical protein [Alphaproteobacteria bacterium]MBP7761946.1 hypothetical protein [Alphaproteobacteria bacterium]MBP7905770.1 hypothetical protein [Alphaproteobacteria bacterium]
MTRKLLLLGFMTLGFGRVFSFGHAYAVNYTALPGESLKSEKSREKDSENTQKQGAYEDKCSEKDIKNIRKYDKKFKNFVEDQDDLIKGAGIETLDSDASKRSDLEQLFESFTEYLTSEEHEAVVASYKECKLEMPILPDQRPFWLP